MPQKDDRFYAEEVQEIMGTIPSWIVRRGIIVIFLIFISLFVGSFFIKYPRTVTATISVMTINIPADVVAKYTGTIHAVLAYNDTDLKEGDIIAVLSTPANYKDVLAIEKLLSKKSNVPFCEIIKKEGFYKEYKLGELQLSWAELIKETKTYQDYINTDYIGKKIKLLKDRVSKNNEFYLKQKKQEKYLNQDLVYEAKNILRDSVLLSNEAISITEYETSVRQYLSKKNEITGFESTIISTELSILQMEQDIVELSIQQQNEQTEYERKLEKLRKQLLSQIEQWKNQYIFSSPITGRLSLVDFRKDQYINIGEVLATVVPQGEMKIVGKMEVSSNGFGQVEKGQTVNVKLNGFPYMEFGMLKGQVVSIAATPRKNEQGLFYTIEVEFPNGLVTTYHKKLPMIQQMDGSGEIITKDMKLIEQFIQPIKSLFKNQ